jgi:hypothetical protein
MSRVKASGVKTEMSQLRKRPQTHQKVTHSQQWQSRLGLPCIAGQRWQFGLGLWCSWLNPFISQHFCLVAIDSW